MTTNKLGLPQIAGSMAADVPLVVNNLAKAVDDKAGVAGGLALHDDVAGKASKDEVTALSGAIAGKAEKAALDEVTGKLADTEQFAVRNVLNAPNKNILVSFMYDDGNANVWTTIKPAFDAEGVPASICAITSTFNDPNYLNVNQLKELKVNGWTVANHGHNHIDMQAATLATAENDIVTSKNLLKQHGLDHDILVYPYGAYSAALLPIVRKYNRFAITTPPNKYNNSPLDTFELKRISGIGEPNQTLATVQAAIDSAPSGSWVIIMGHTGYAAYNEHSTLTDLTALIQYIKGKGIEIVNVEEGWKRKGNIVDVGTGKSSFKVGTNGEVRISKKFEDYSYDNATPITYFPYGENVTYFNNNEIVGKGFPVGDNGGIVTTVRIAMEKYVSEDASYQTFQPYYENSLYRRRWLTGTSTWSAWELIAKKIEGNFHSVNSTLNAYTAAQLITAYPANSIVTFRVNSSGAVGYPVGQAGTVTTFRLGGNGWDRQEFRVYNSNDMYKRFVNVADGSWTAWELTNNYYISAGFNEFTGLQAVTVFIQNRITVFRSDIGTPNGIGGTFTVTRIGGSGYPSQKFIEYNTGREYVRYATLPDGAWSAWKEYAFVTV